MGSKAIYYCAASLDGYIAESDDTLDWLLGYSGTFEGEGLEPEPMVKGGAYERFYDQVGALVSGSATYQFILDQMEAGDPWPYKTMPYWVLSSRDVPLPAVDEHGVRIVNTTVTDLWGELSAAAGERDVWIVGGGNVASQFADAGLLDELHVTVVPVVLGTGKPLFDRRLPADTLQLLGSTIFANGMVELRYAVKA
jgi:dihydrofolate reductase